MAINQASSGISFASLECGPESISAQPDKIIVAKAKGNERKKDNFLFIGLREGSFYGVMQKSPLARAFENTVKNEEELLSAVVHYAKPNFAEVVHAHVRFLEILVENTLV